MLPLAACLSFHNQFSAERLFSCSYRFYHVVVGWKIVCQEHSGPEIFFQALHSADLFQEHILNFKGFFIFDLPKRSRSRLVDGMPIELLQFPPPGKRVLIFSLDFPLPQCFGEG